MCIGYDKKRTENAVAATKLKAGVSGVTSQPVPTPCRRWKRVISPGDAQRRNRKPPWSVEIQVKDLAGLLFDVGPKRRDAGADYMDVE